MYWYAVYDGDKRVSQKFHTRLMAVHEAYQIKPDWLITPNNYTIKEIQQQEKS